MPSLLVVLDRFFHVPSVTNFPRQNLCRLGFLCEIGLPGYFTWIIFSVYAVGVIIIAFGQSILGRIESLFQAQDLQSPAIPRAQSALSLKLKILAIVALLFIVIYSVLLQRIPGAELLLVLFLWYAALRLQEKPVVLPAFSEWSNTAIQKIPLYGTIIFSQAVLLLFLSEISASVDAVPWVYYLLLLTAIVLVIWQFKHLGKLYWIFTIGIVIYTLNFNSWIFSKIGDEYSFFYAAVDITRQSFLSIFDKFFHMQFVYNEQSYISSILQAIFIRFFGADRFGWAISNVFLVLITIPLFFNFLKTLLISELLFLRSHSWLSRAT